MDGNHSQFLSATFRALQGSRLDYLFFFWRDRICNHPSPVQNESDSPPRNEERGMTLLCFLFRVSFRPESESDFDLERLKEESLFRDYGI